jgi:hypothetical protein
VSERDWKTLRCIGRHTLGAAWDYVATVNTEAAIVVVAESTEEPPVQKQAETEQKGRTG